MFASLSFESRLAAKLSRWGMSVGTLSALIALEGIGVSKTRLARALNGHALSNHIALALEPLLAEIDAFMTACSPLAIDTTIPPAELFSQIKGFHDGKLRISITHD